MFHLILYFVPLFSLGVCGSLISNSSSSCKAAPGSSDWPAPETWGLLNQTTEGRLLQAVPPGAVCHPTQPSYNTTLCPYVQYDWFNEYFHSRNPISSEWNNWNNDSCLPDPRAPCSTEGYPVYVINATTASHVKTGVDFARQNNIRLIIKNSGHDFVGRSSAGSSLSIWVHHMKAFQVHENSFTPKNCNITINGPAITAGAGTQMLEAYTAAAEYNLTVVGGNGRTVALGGFLTGAGHSILAPHYGLAADQVLEMEVVTPGGEVLMLNECQNTDLFWAMRGGGGGTFGVMTSVTMKAVPSPQIMNFNFWVATPANNPHAFEMVAYFLSQFPSLIDAGISGYPEIFNSVPSSYDPSAIVSGIMGEVLMLNTTNSSDPFSLFDPIFNHINTTWPGEWSMVANTTFYPTHYAWYQQNYDPSPTGYENIMSSRLLDKQALMGNLTKSKEAFEKFSEGGMATVFMVTGKGVHDAVPRGGSNAVLPAWRSAYIHSTASLAFQSLNETAKVDAIATTSQWADGLRELAPDMGAYVNEGAGRYEPNWQHSFWGENYPRLSAIKKSVDPDDTLWCQPCVGNEGWQEVDGRLCRV